jgi:hypothetical protein
MSEVATRYPGLKSVVFSEAEIAERVAELGREIDAFYPLDEELVMIGLLKGAFVFLSDLARAMGRPSLTVDFLVAALYGEGTDPSREVRLLYDMETPVEGRHVLFQRLALRAPLGRVRCAARLARGLWIRPWGEVPSSAVHSGHLPRG